MAFNPNIKRQENTSIDIDKRISSFDEVIIPLNKEEILLETNRCLSCPKPRCVEGCPIHLPIPQMIKFVNEGKEKEAYQLINDVSPLSGICSIVCDHHSQCEGNCVRGIKDKPVNIGSIHRYVAYLNENYEIKINNSKKEHIAVIGAGPSGLSVAIELRKLGYNVTIYEKESSLGGVPFYSIPNFRLANEQMNKAYSSLSNIGINFIFNKEISVNDIVDKYDAVYIAIGTQKGKYMRLPNENLKGIFTAEEFLKDIKLDNNIIKYATYHNAFVVGGGNVAMDVSRTLVRLGKKTTIVYRRSIEEAPCRKDELLASEQEGVKLSFLTNPIGFNGNEKLESINLIKMELGEPDESGRRSPVEIKNSEFTLPADLVILAIGSSLDTNYVEGIELNRNLIKVNEYQTSNQKVFAGGDAVTGPNTVVHAIKAGKSAAIKIDNFLSNK